MLATAFALVLVAAAGGDGDSPAPPAAGVADDSVCAVGEPCTLINGYADPNSTGKTSELVTFEEIADELRPSTACPSAARGYAEAGIEVDGFLGPCPEASDLEGASAAAETAESVGLELGESR
jgi:hypothetical protein